MNEYRRMVDAIDATTAPAYLATVVDVAGSAYRRPGARMLMLVDGTRIGSISGGCLERDLSRSAAWLTEGGPVVVHFDTRSESPTVNPRYNLGCAGVIHVLVERITRDARCPLHAIRCALDQARPTVVATCYHVDGASPYRIGQRLNIDGDHDLVRHLAPIRDNVAGTGAAVCVELTDGEATSRSLVERIDPPRPLWIFGAGDDAQPLCAMAAELGWSVVVIDHRAGQLTAARFPRANMRHVSRTADVPSSLRATPETAAVLMTHDLEVDAILLPWLLESCCGSVGVLGPKSRTARLMRKLSERGTLPSPSALRRLRAPVGLDLGAATPAGIAVSILSEIIALDNGRTGGRLAERRGPIHAPAAHVLIDTGLPMAMSSSS